MDTRTTPEENGSTREPKRPWIDSMIASSFIGGAFAGAALSSLIAPESSTLIGGLVGGVVGAASVMYLVSMKRKSIRVELVG